MAHLRRVTDWPQVAVDPEDPSAGKRDATRQELLDRWLLVVVGDHPDGGWIMDCGVLGKADLGRERAGAWDDLPGTVIAHGSPDHRYLNGPPAVQAHACRAVVYRERGADLRGRLAADTQPVRTSPAGAGALPRVVHREEDPASLVEAARSALEAQGPDAEPRIRRMRVAPADVRDSDVVERAAEPGHRWAGER